MLASGPRLLAEKIELAIRILLGNIRGRLYYRLALGWCSDAASWFR